MSDTSDASRIVPLRLQRFLARAGIASRRKSEDLMTAGRVQVNGVTVTELGTRVDPLTDEVTVDGRPVRLADGPTTLMLNKPAGYLTTMSDPHGRPTVAELVPVADHPGLYPVGRLDVDTTGLLLFTTDGALGQQLLHPSHHVDKHYVALVKGRPTRNALFKLRRGVRLDDGPTAPAQVTLYDPDDPITRAVAPGGVPFGHTAVGLTIHEGRKHQVKRMLESVGCPVVALHRDTFGPLALSDLPIGSWRLLTPDELSTLNNLSTPTPTPSTSSNAPTITPATADSPAPGSATPPDDTPVPVVL